MDLLSGVPTPAGDDFDDVSNAGVRGQPLNRIYTVRTARASLSAFSPRPGALLSLLVAATIPLLPVSPHPLCGSFFLLLHYRWLHALGAAWWRVRGDATPRAQSIARGQRGQRRRQGVRGSLRWELVARALPAPPAAFAQAGLFHEGLEVVKLSN